MATEEPSTMADDRDVETVEVNCTGLSKVGVRPGLLAYFNQVWEFLHFILLDSRSRIACESAADNLGRVWMVLNPILQGAAYYLVFGVILGTSRGIENFVAYLMIGVFMYRFTVSTVVAGSKAISGNRALVSAFNFP